jgi:serine phosphatase RsbU (regulator of sigma subunit)
MPDAARRSRSGDHVPLRRLLDRETTEALIGAAMAARPGGHLALIETDGTAFAGSGAWLLPLTARLRRGLAGVTGDTIPVAKGVRLFPLRIQSRVVGGLVVHDPAAEGMVRILRHSLTMILRKSLESRDLGQETLDRYREINLLYRLGETIGASLDVHEIPRLVLTEAQSAIHADAGAVLIASEGRPRAEATQGRPAIVDVMVEAARRITDQVMESSQPRIEVLPATEAPPLAAILCVPIRAQDKTLGAVVLGRREGRTTFSAGEEKLLLAIASEGGVAYDRALLHQGRVQRERLEEELSIGRRIQLSLLPASSPIHPGWEFAAIYRAARQVGGDFYDFIEMPESPGTVNLVIGDVTGKGVPAALLMASTRAVLRASSDGEQAPSSVLERTNQQMLRDGSARLFVTALYGELDLPSGRFTFASGGHDPPLWVRGGTRRSQLLTTRSSILGAFEELDLEDRRIDMAPGDLLVLYTDGVTEARDRRGRLFGERRLGTVVSAAVEGTANDVADAVLKSVLTFAGDVPLPDDLTLLVVKRLLAG